MKKYSMMRVFVNIRTMNIEGKDEERF